MVCKEINIKGETFLVKLKEIGSQKDGFECNILRRGLFFKHKVYTKIFLKGMNPNYLKIMLSTIDSYIEEQENKSKNIDNLVLLDRIKFS